MYKKRLRDNGVEIVYAAESNIAGAEGIIIEGVMEALAEYYSAELAEKMRRGMRESASRAGHQPMPCCLGNERNTNRVFN